MGFLRGFSSVMAPARMRAGASDYTSAFFAGDDLPDSWVASLSAAGVNVTPDLAMTLSAMYCGVTTIAYDLATCPLQTRKYRPNDEGSDPVRGRASDMLTGGITDLAYMLQWAPNDYQTATEYFVGQVAQYLLRGKAYAEIVDGPRGFLSQLLPRHPDRVRAERLPTGRLRYQLTEANGQTRYLTQDEMHVVRDLSTDGVQMISRTVYGAGALGSALAAERAAGKFFKSGMTASVVATYKGDMEDEDEKALHQSITRYAAGVENTFGLLLIPDDVTIANLGVNPDKAQMMLAREWGAREIARLLRMPPHKLMISGTQTYASQVQSATDYVVGCLRPIAHTFEQAMQRDLILQKDQYFVRFKLAELLRGDPIARADYFEKAIKNRWMRPSEVRLEEGFNPDPALDALSERDNQPGQSKSSPAPAPAPDVPPMPTRTAMKGMLAVHDNAVRCVRRERVAIEKLAKKHANDVAGWQSALREFEADQAGFVSEVMRVPLAIARGYCAQHGSAFEAKGVVLIDGAAGAAWERCEADGLAAIAWDDEAAA